MPVGTPAELLRRRPDIRAAERNLAASTALVGVAVSNLFPKVTFTGSFGFAAAEPAGFGSAGSRTYIIGPGIYLGRPSTSAGCGRRSPARGPAR